jgi:hypothetical protein
MEVTVVVVVEKADDLFKTGMGVTGDGEEGSSQLVSMAAEDRGGEVSGLLFMDGRDQLPWSILSLSTFTAVVVSVWM